MLRRFHQKIGCLLGLLAILMVTFAPTISHVRADGHRDGGMAGMHCSMPSMEGPMPDDKPSSHSNVFHCDVCGYCNLLAHLSALPSMQTPFTTMVWALRHRIATRFESLLRVETLISAQPRAPPASS